MREDEFLPERLGVDVGEEREEIGFRAHVIEGGVLSFTVKICAQVLTLPHESCAW